MEPRLTRKAEREMEEAFANEREAWALLDLINAEFQYWMPLNSRFLKGSR